MRGWILRSALAVALLATPLWAQRGGGGGGHGGFGGAHGFSGGGHVGAPSGFHGSPGGSNGWHGNGWGWHGNGWRGYPVRFRGWRGYPGWGYTGYGYPYWGGYGWYDDFDDSYDQPYGPYGQGYPPPYDSSYSYVPPSGAAVSYATEGEVERIQNEVAQLRAQQAARYAEPAHQSTVLIYRDGHKETVENYAVADSTVWIFNQDRARKVPLSELDVPATERDNEARGGEFVLPNSH